MFVRIKKRENLHFQTPTTFFSKTKKKRRFENNSPEKAWDWIHSIHVSCSLWKPRENIKIIIFFHFFIRLMKRWALEFISFYKSKRMYPFLSKGKSFLVWNSEYYLKETCCICKWMKYKKKKRASKIWIIIITYMFSHIFIY